MEIILLILGVGFLASKGSGSSKFSAPFERKSEFKDSGKSYHSSSILGSFMTQELQGSLSTMEAEALKFPEFAPKNVAPIEVVIVGSGSTGSSSSILSSSSSGNISGSNLLNPVYPSQSAGLIDQPLEAAKPQGSLVPSVVEPVASVVEPVPSGPVYNGSITSPNDHQY